VLHDLKGRALDQAARKLFDEDLVLTSLKCVTQTAPWTWTKNYVECHLQGKGSGMLQLDESSGGVHGNNGGMGREE
jgi:hypothetical protein